MYFKAKYVQNFENTSLPGQHRSSLSAKQMQVYHVYN